jgi:hypothetical protein
MESQIPAHEKAAVPADTAAELLVESWASLGFDVRASADALIEALLPFASPPEQAQAAPEQAQAAPEQAQAAHSFSQLVLTPSPKQPPAQASTPAKQAACKLCGGTGCRACG